MIRKFPFVLTILRGLGQIMLQENAATGLLFLFGIFHGSVVMGIAALLATICGTLTAKVFGFDKTETEKGLYGFSAALVGVALVLFFEPVTLIWILIVVGSVIAALIQHFFIRREIPVFTLPFVLVTWVIMFLVHKFYPEVTAASEPVDILNDFTFAFRGFGEVIFQGSIISGVVFFIAVFINSPAAALYGLAGAIVAGVLSAFFSAPAPDVAMGLFSYNAVLCAIVFAGDKLKDGFSVLIAVVLSVIISLVMYKYSLTQLTFPFVAASCINLVLRKGISNVFGEKIN